MRVFLISVAIFLAIIVTLALAGYLILVDTRPMGKLEYLAKIGKLATFSYTGLGRLDDTEIKMIYEGTCTRKCHSRDVVERSAHNIREWEDIISRMRNVNNARITKSEAGVIATYLTKYYGSNIPTTLTAEGGRYLKKYLWRSDFGESDIYVDVIYTPIQYFNLSGGKSEEDGYKADKHTMFKIYINTHQNKLALFPLERLAVMKTSEGREYKPLLWKVIYESGDGHHREGVLVFKKLDNQPASMSVSLLDLPGQKERIFLWDLPIPEKPGDHAGDGDR